MFVSVVCLLTHTTLLCRNQLYSCDVRDDCREILTVHFPQGTMADSLGQGRTGGRVCGVLPKTIVANQWATCLELGNCIATNKAPNLVDSYGFGKCALVSCRVIILGSAQRKQSIEVFLAFLLHCSKYGNNQEHKQSSLAQQSVMNLVKWGFQEWASQTILSLLVYFLCILLYLWEECENESIYSRFDTQNGGHGLFAQHGVY